MELGNLHYWRWKYGTQELEKNIHTLGNVDTVHCKGGLHSSSQWITFILIKHYNQKLSKTYKLG